MATATSSPPAPMASMPIPPPVGVWESEPRRVLPGPAEALQVHLVADAVAGAGEDDAVLRGDGLQVAVVVGVLEPDLEGVVVDVAHREFGP